MRDSGGQFVMTVGILMTHRYLVLHKDVDELLRLTEGGGWRGGRRGDIVVTDIEG